MAKAAPQTVGTESIYEETVVEEILRLILANANRIARAITTGAQFEIWMQVDLFLLLGDAGFRVAREVRYPPPFAGRRADFLIRNNRDQTAVAELKVESAFNAGTIAGARGLASVDNDINKIRDYNAGPGLEKWVIVVAFSGEIRRALLNRFANSNVPPGLVVHGHAEGVFVMILRVV